MTKRFVIFCVTLLAGLGFANGEDEAVEPKIFELTKRNMTVKFTDMGASIISVLIPDKDGKVDDVVLGHDSLEAYKNNSVYFGATVGRVANRIGGAKFVLDGKEYKLGANDGKNTLHGGPKGFSSVLWNVKIHDKDGNQPRIVFNYHSPDGEDGFPGDLDVTVSYSLVGYNQLSVTFRAVSLNKDTPVNLAQHTYWNLGGHKSGTILDEEVQIFGSKITEVDSELIPTGKLLPVAGTPYDFLKPNTVGGRISQLPKGYDINYALDVKSGNRIHKAAVLHDKKSGRVLEVDTSAPGLQFYTGGLITEINGKDGAVYKTNAGLCLETQDFPDSVNQPDFPSIIVTPKRSYKRFMIYRFSTKD